MKKYLIGIIALVAIIIILAFIAIYSAYTLSDYFNFGYSVYSVTRSVVPNDQFPDRCGCIGLKIFKHCLGAYYCDSIN